MAKSLHRFALSLLTVPMLLAGCGSTGMLPAGTLAASQLSAYGHRTSENTLLVEPDMGVSPILQAIDSAKKSVQLVTYMITMDGDAAKIVQALVDRAKSGVPVQVLIEGRPYVPGPDGKPAPNPSIPAIKALMAGGVRVSYANPRFRFTHEKAMVIDNQVAYIMTCNFSNSAFNGNREYVLVDRTAADVSEVAHIFAADWLSKPITPKDPNLVESPDNSRGKLLNLINSAHKSLMIQFEYFEDPAIAEAVGERVKAGVDVKVMLGAAYPGEVDTTSPEETQLLNSNGITQIEFTKSVQMHAKAIIVDGARAFLGSENLTANSLDNNREMGVIVTDPAIVQKMTQIAAHDWAAK
ncbi:MAG TPA: phosphatidylserine/phosphatidylglycerophosphate/cardiolipin synthase family protein [Oscillatoriaceae cyanobacterium]